MFPSGQADAGTGNTRTLWQEHHMPLMMEHSGGRKNWEISTVDIEPVGDYTGN